MVTSLARALAAAAVVLALTGCGGAPAGEQVLAAPADPAPAAADAPLIRAETVRIALDGRPFDLRLPVGHLAGRTAPLLVALHGYSEGIDELVSELRLAEVADQRGYLVALPLGTGPAPRFWDAGGVCCNFTGVPVDDSGYLSRVIATIAADHAVDPARTYLIGHSNGGFMAYRFACDHADQVAAIVSLAGALAAEPEPCAPSRPVSALQVHGTADEVIRFDGGTYRGRGHTSAEETVGRWRAIGSPADLWVLPGAGHSPKLTRSQAAYVFDWLDAHAAAATAATRSEAGAPRG